MFENEPGVNVSPHVSLPAQNLVHRRDKSAMSSLRADFVPSRYFCTPSNQGIDERECLVRWKEAGALEDRARERRARDSVDGDEVLGRQRSV